VLLYLMGTLISFARFSAAAMAVRAPSRVSTGTDFDAIAAIADVVVVDYIAVRMLAMVVAIGHGPRSTM
jgi:hypothetical protein